MKNFNDTIGNRNRDLQACSQIPQPSAPPRTPLQVILNSLLREDPKSIQKPANNRNTITIGINSNRSKEA